MGSGAGPDGSPVDQMTSSVSVDPVGSSFTKGPMTSAHVVVRPASSAAVVATDPAVAARQGELDVAETQWTVESEDGTAGLPVRADRPHRREGVAAGDAAADPGGAIELQSSSATGSTRSPR